MVTTSIFTGKFSPFYGKEKFVGNNRWGKGLTDLSLHCKDRECPQTCYVIPNSPYLGKNVPLYKNSADGQDVHILALPDAVVHLEIKGFANCLHLYGSVSDDPNQQIQCKVGIMSIHVGLQM